ncbi:MAG: family 10 glycosylhydrolase [Planctomycetota bacterium]
MVPRVGGLTILVLVLVAAALRSAAGAADRDPDVEGVARRELRAAWVATVSNIDWPSRPGLPSDEQRAELLRLLDRAVELHLNAVMLQVRPMCDALYPSELEPWSEWLTGTQGQPPEPLWDPLAEAVAAAHARGLELHAWFNPFRAWHVKARSKPSGDHVSRTMTRAVVRYGGQQWLDPAQAIAQRHSLRVILDVVQRYDVDGVHIDDYFYPYPEHGRAFDDDASYQLYRSEGGILGRADWRRQNVDRFVAGLYRQVKRRKPWVKVGISPFGIARPGVPTGIAAGLDQYDDLYADVRKWLAEGWLDYLAPQLYWRIRPPQQSYATLLQWWATQNPKSRHLWPGSFTSNTLPGGKGWPAAEIVEQVAWSRRVAGASGQIHFSMKALMPGMAVGRALLDGPYADLALVPAASWLDAEAPGVPQLSARWRDREVELRALAPDPDVRFYAVYAQTADGKWRLVRRLGATLEPTGRFAVHDAARSLAITAIDRVGNEGPALAVNRRSRAR